METRTTTNYTEVEWTYLDKSSTKVWKAPANGFVYHNITWSH